jgi:hypothetical protein
LEKSVQSFLQDLPELVRDFQKLRRKLTVKEEE